MSPDLTLLIFLIMSFAGMATLELFNSLTLLESGLLVAGILLISGIVTVFIWERFSKSARERRKRLEKVKELPAILSRRGTNSIFLGREVDLDIPIYLPDSIRSRHVHVLGATGSGKTESVILNFLRQDVKRGLGAIVLDAKGEASFGEALRKWVPEKRLRIFDLSSDESNTYNPLEVGNPLESAQRLFSSLTWSEEYYKSKALSSLQRIFQTHFERCDRNPKLVDLLEYLENPGFFVTTVTNSTYPKKLAERDFGELSGLRDQVRSLCLGHLSKTLSPESEPGIRIEASRNGQVLYFRLQSLISPQTVTTLGKLLINHLNYMAGTAHREEHLAKDVKLTPVYLDEFASFACPEFADLISKARSVGMALHFSHQSIGDLTEVSKGFLNRITDNSATKIVMRINDPDSADFFARSFGTNLIQKVTQKVTNATETDLAEIVGEGSQREAHQFRASPDLFKTLSTGMGSVLIAHGIDTSQGGSSVLKARFPFLRH